VAVEETGDMKKILVLNDNRSPAGGADHVALIHVAEFRRNGLDARYFSAGQGAVESYPIAPRYFARNLFNIGAYREIRRELHDFDPDVVFIHSWTKQLSASVLLACRGRDVRIVAHDYFLMCPNGGQYNYRRREKCELRGGTLGCLAVNCDKRSYVEKLFRFLRFHIQNAIVRTVRPRVYCLNEIQWNGLSGSHRLSKFRNPVMTGDAVTGDFGKYAYVGRSDPEKGIGIFAADELRSTKPILFVGPEHVALNSHLQGEFLGWLDRDAIQALMPSIRAVIFPSIWHEVDPLTPWEFMGRGVPVVASIENVFGQSLANEIPELVYRTPSELTQALARLDDDTYHASMRTRCLALARSEQQHRLAYSGDFLVGRFD